MTHEEKRIRRMEMASAVAGGESVTHVAQRFGVSRMTVQKAVREGQEGPIEGMPNGRCAVYRIINVITGESYVGVTKNIQRRFSQHMTDLAAGEHFNKAFQASYNRWGRMAFAIGILEFCSAAEKADRECWWIGHLKAEFNHMYNYAAQASKQATEAA